jgi:geranylgeranyl reductase family protein
VAASCDVLVIGAGPAGCAAAIAATRAGARVRVLDRATFPRDKTCGDAVSNRAAAIIDDLVGEPRSLHGIPHAVVHGAVAVLPDGRRIGRDFGDDPGYIVPRLHLDDLLRRALEDSGASLEQGCAVRRLVSRGGRIVGVETDGATLTATAIVAADGPGSVAWAALGKPYQRGRSLAVAITGYYEGVCWDDAPGVAEHYFEPGLQAGYGWVFPDVDGRANVGVYQRSDRFHAHGRSLKDLLASFLARHPERLRSARRVGRTRSWALPLSVRVIPPGAPGLLVCGDAGYFVDPLSGEGIFQALHTGVLAGRAAASAVATGSLDRKIVRRYQRRCARDIGLPSLARLGVQEAMTRVVDHGLYRARWVDALLRRGYGSDRLEVSKRTTTAAPPSQS